MGNRLWSIVGNDARQTLDAWKSRIGCQQSQIRYDANGTSVMHRTHGYGLSADKGSTDVERQNVCYVYVDVVERTATTLRAPTAASGKSQWLCWSSSLLLSYTKSVLLFVLRETYPEI